MPLPRSKLARDYFRAARERLSDAEFLIRESRTTAAVYLSGYSVECLLKALIVNSVPDREKAEIAASFRGTAGHDLDRLRRQYSTLSRVNIPRTIELHFWEPPCDTNLPHGE